MSAEIKTPAIASTISPPRHVMASVERGKLGKSERVALAGLAGYQGGASWMGAVVAGSSTRGYVSGDLQSVPRNSFSGELAAPTPLNPNGLSADALAGIFLAHAADGSTRRAFEFEGVTYAVRETTDGDAILPRIVESVAARKSRLAAEAKAAARPTRKATPSEGDAITLGDRPTVTHAETVEDLVPAFLASMGHKGKIDARMRSLALDAMAARAQVAEYAAR